MIKKILKYLFLAIGLYLFLCVITPFNSLLRDRSVKNQITYLDKIFRKGYDDKLQKRFPEGKLFSNAIFSLSIIEFCETRNIIDAKYAEILDQSIKRITSKRALRPFNHNLQPKYGIFYNGWTNYVLKEYQKSELYKHSSIKEKIENLSQQIESAIVQTQTDSLRLLDSYLESNWPADNLIGILSIDNDSIQQKWVDLILNKTEHDSGLIYHTGSNKSQIRGSSQALLTFCLSKINYVDVKDYNQRFKDLFIKEYLGVQMVMENEDGSDRMDVDSGPVLFGFGASATVMNIKTQARLNNHKSKRTWALMNTISFTINLFGKKYFLFGKEPMFDIFMLWSCVELM